MFAHSNSYQYFNTNTMREAINKYMEAIEKHYGYAFAAGYFGQIVKGLITGEMSQLDALEYLTTTYNGIQEEKNV